MNPRPRRRPRARRPAIDPQRVREVAALARLRLEPGETERLERELARILEWARKLDELDTSGVAPTSHPLALPGHEREDVVGPSLAVEAALAGAPERVGDAFGVPKILE